VQQARVCAATAFVFAAMRKRERLTRHQLTTRRVIAGLDPAIHQEKPFAIICAMKMDARVKPGHDD
jgi:hypothetical protein